MKIIKRTDLNNADEQVLTYIKLLLQKKGMDIMPPDILADMILDLYGRFEAYLMVSLLNRIDPAKYAEFDEAVESEDQAARAVEFFKENLPDYNEAIMDAMADFEKTYLEA
jgi:hypothetical protein